MKGLKLAYIFPLAYLCVLAIAISELNTIVRFGLYFINPSYTVAFGGLFVGTALYFMDRPASRPVIYVSGFLMMLTGAVDLTVALPNTLKPVTSIYSTVFVVVSGVVTVYYLLLFSSLKDSEVFLTWDWK